jgi:hypothetical protein
MDARTRTAIATTFRTYRRQRDWHLRKAEADPVAWSAKLSRDLAEHYRTLLAGAVDMLNTIRDS